MNKIDLLLIQNPLPWHKTRYLHLKDKKTNFWAKWKLACKMGSDVLGAKKVIEGILRLIVLLFQQLLKHNIRSTRVYQSGLDFILRKLK